MKSQDLLITLALDLVGHHLLDTLLNALLDAMYDHSITRSYRRAYFTNLPCPHYAANPCRIVEYSSTWETFHKSAESRLHLRNPLRIAFVARIATS
jgi:hypothetical protein